MITSRHIEKIVAVIVAAAVILCSLAVVFSQTLSEYIGSSSINLEYETELFDNSDIIELDILMDEDKWNEMLENAINEEYYQCDVVVNGTTFYNVAIRPKGNTSLSTIANDPSTVRYSFKLEFDKYVDGQTCFGLDKLVLNNNYADATNMKEAVIYDMFAYLGADASLYNYADISVNGETWGVYLALEAVEDSFMLRNYSTSNGNLYKPDSMNFGGAGGMKNIGSDELNEIAEQFFGPSEKESNSDKAQTARPQKGQSGGNSENAIPDNGEFQMPDMENMPNMGMMPDMSEITNMSGMPDMGNMPDFGEMPEGGEFPQMPQSENSTTENDTQTPQFSGSRGGMGGGMSGNGTALNYIDDELDSYSSIWESEVNSTTDSDHRRVVEALKNISEQTDVEDYLDIENMIKYMAVHTFSVNLDSLSGSMTHNYYLYEQNGKLNLIPWDYNLAFGGFSQGRSGSGATNTVNFPIDTPFSSGISLEDRQIFAAILESKEYLAQYHECLRILSEEYVNGGKFDALYTNIRNRIDSLVENDPNAFYSYDEYNIAAETLKKIVSLRSESIIGQLGGTIPSTNNGQNENSEALIDASEININDMGSMNIGGGMSPKSPADFSAVNGKPSSLSDGSEKFAGKPQRGESADISPSISSLDGSTLLWLFISSGAIIVAIIIAVVFKRRKR